MRATSMLVAAALAACSPEIAPGSYLCGPDGLCPEGQACNGPDNVCVAASQAQPFTCDPAIDPAGDDQPATGAVLPAMLCVSVPLDRHGCMTAADAADFFQFDVPSTCGGVKVEASLVYPIAFQPLGLELSTGGAAATRAETACPASMTAVEGSEIVCASQTLAAGGHYAFGIVKDGAPSCDGACEHNRYTFRIRLATP